MRRLLSAVLIFLLLAGSAWGASTFFPWNLRLGSPYALDLADVSYDGILRAIPTDATSTYPRLRDMGKGRDDNAVLYSGQMLDCNVAGSEYVDCGAGASGILSDGDWTIVTTINISGTGSMFFLGTNYRYSNYWACRVDDTNGLTFRSDEECASYALSGMPVNSGEIVRAVFIRSGRNFKGYINGELITTAIDYFNVDADFTTSGYQLGIGGVPPSGYFDGLIGNVQIWNAAWDADDVAFDYANPELRASDRPGTLLDGAATKDGGNCAGWWPSIEGSGDTLYDWSGNGNNGVLTNFTTPDDIGWANGAALSDPHVCQTALMNWGMGSNNLETTDLLDDTYWLSASIDRVGGYEAPDGSMTAVKLTSNGLDPNAGAPSICIAGDQRSIWARSVSGSGTADILNKNTDANRDPVTLTEEWQRFECNYDDLTENPTFFYLADFRGADITLTEFLLWNPQNEPATTASATTITNALPATNALTPIRSWESAGQFTRDVNELNFRAGVTTQTPNSADVSPSTAVIFEMVFNCSGLTSSERVAYKSGSYQLQVTTDQLYVGYLTIDGSARYPPYVTMSENILNHIIETYDEGSKTLNLYYNGFFVSSTVLSGLADYKIATTTTPLELCDYAIGVTQIAKYSILTDTNAQKIIDGNIDTYVLRQFKKQTPGAGIYLGTGDSFANSLSDWPHQLSVLVYGGVNSKGYSGKYLSGSILANFETNLAEHPYTHCVIQGGVNDIASNVSIGTITSAMETMVEYAISQGVTPACVNVAPWEGVVSWTSEKQIVTEAYNTWLASYCTTNSIPLADIYTALGDGTALHADYDSGDHLHPNTAGSIVIAETIKAAMEAE